VAATAATKGSELGGAGARLGELVVDPAGKSGPELPFHPPAGRPALVVQCEPEHGEIVEEATVARL
jgi:hypothetical protein